MNLNDYLFEHDGYITIDGKYHLVAKDGSSIEVSRDELSGYFLDRLARRMQSVYETAMNNDLSMDDM